MEYVVGVDIGGTFTDCVVLDDHGQISVGKSSSTPPDFSVGVLNAVQDAATRLGFGDSEELLRQTRTLFHACTVGENTLIGREGANTGLLATKGFADTIFIMRGQITEGLTEAEANHMAALTKPEPYVRRSAVEEITERIDSNGDTVIPLDESEVSQSIARLAEQGVESVAVAFLWSSANNSHERAVAELIRQQQPQMYVTLSSEVAPFMGEYERTATTIFNAYIAPKISRYLASLQFELRNKGLKREPLIMQAYGGVLDIPTSSRNAVGTIESGPAAGVVGSRFLGELVGEKNILAADMGGTTFKVSVIRDGEIERENMPVFLRHRILSPKVWVESIGAGGGSIAWIDPESGLLKVGPRGAGARPGPVCYQAGGTEPTVSDADCVLGYLNPDYFLGGQMRLDKEAARQAIRQKIAEPLEMSEVEAARGIFKIANAHMSDLMRRATVERGHDPRDFILFAYGGAGPVHAARYAAELGIRSVLIPATASVQGAAGLIGSNIMYQYGMTDFLSRGADVQRINANFSVLCERALRDLTSAGFQEQQISIVRGVDMRYRYQVNELSVPFPPGTEPLGGRDLEDLYNRFDELYEKVYGKGSGYREAGQDIITFRVTAVGELPKPEFQRGRIQRIDSKGAKKGARRAYFEEYGDYTNTNLYDFERMVPGMEIEGPAIIETSVTTIVVNPKDRAKVDELHNVRIFVGA